MSKSNSEGLDLDGLERLAAAYGGDLDRWPAQHRRAAASLVEGSPEARRRLAEAMALDRLLDRASAPDPLRHAALTDRIVAAATTVGRPTAIVVPLPVRREAARGPAAISPRPTRGRFGSVSQAAAVLAASLMLGVTLGALDVVPASFIAVIADGTQQVEADPAFATLSVDGLSAATDEDQQ